MKQGIAGRNIMAIALLGMLCGLSVPTAGATEYLGEFCWRVTFDEDTSGAVPPSTGVNKYAVTQMAEGYYMLQGKGISDNPGYHVIFAMIDGNYLIGTESSTFDSEESIRRETRIGQFKLDLATLSGTIWRNKTRFNTSARVRTEIYQAGTVTFVPCP